MMSFNVRLISGVNALAPLVIHIANGFQQAVELKAIHGAGENNGGVIEKEKLVLHPLAKFAEGGQAFRGHHDADPFFGGAQFHLGGQS